MVDSSPGLVLKELARAAFKKWHVFNRTSHTEELVLPLHGANTGVAAGETMRLRNQGEGSPPPLQCTVHTLYGTRATHVIPFKPSVGLEIRDCTSVFTQ